MRDKRRRIEFLKRKQPKCPAYGLSLGDCYRGWCHLGGGKWGDEGCGCRDRGKMKGWIANLPETNDAEEEEQEREWLQKNDEDESESDLLELTGRLGTRMKCVQREVEATDERIAKTKKLSSVSPRSPKRKKRRKKR